MYEKWYGSIINFFSDVLNSKSPEFVLDQVSMSLWEIMIKEKMSDFIHELVADEQAFIDDEWHIDTPRYLSSEGVHVNGVRIYMAGNESNVDIKLFCSAVKLSCFFYKAHIDVDFDVWNTFLKLDEFCLRYSEKESN